MKDSLTSNNTFGIADLSAQFQSKMDSLSDVFIEKAQLNKTTSINSLSALDDSKKSELIHSVVSKTLKEAEHSDEEKSDETLAEKKSSKPEANRKTVKEMKKE